MGCRLAWGGKATLSGCALRRTQDHGRRQMVHITAHLGTKFQVGNGSKSRDTLMPTTRATSPSFAPHDVFSVPCNFPPNLRNSCLRPNYLKVTTGHMERVHVMRRGSRLQLRRSSPRSYVQGPTQLGHPDALWQISITPNTSAIMRIRLPFAGLSSFSRIGVALH